MSDNVSTKRDEYFVENNIYIYIYIYACVCVLGSSYTWYS